MSHVVILGAGASSEAGAPLMANFREEAAALAAGIDGEWHGRAAETFRWVMDRWDSALNVEQFYVGIDVRERVLTGAISDGEADAVRYVIAKTLHETTRGLEARSKGQGHLTLMKWLKSKHEAGEDVTVLTLNWDTVLEWAANHQKLPINIGYGEVKTLDGEEPAGVTIQGPRILKLHGSVNWWFCPTGNHLLVEESLESQMKSWELLFPLRCGMPSCLQREGRPRLIPAMVPPTGQKFEGRGQYHRLFANIWKDAYDALSRATKLSIVGYSFPSTDTQFRFFLADALRKAPLGEVEVVLRSPLAPEAEKAYLQGVVSNQLVRSAKFTPIGFGGWTEQLQTKSDKGKQVGAPKRSLG